MTLSFPAIPSDDSSRGATPSGHDPESAAAAVAGAAASAGDARDARRAVDSRGRHVEILDHAWVMEDRGRRKVGPLTDPSDTSFTGLPPADLPDGRSARRAAFEIWAGHVRTKVANGAVWETTWMPRKPLHTLFAMVGATAIGVSCLGAVLIWASSDPRVRHNPGVVEGIVGLAGIAFLLWISWATLSSAARYWLTRLGSYVRIDARGVMLGKDAVRVPASEVAWAKYHAAIRATHVRLRDGRGFWVPREPGPLVRLDLVLASLAGGPAADV